MYDQETGNRIYFGKFKMDIRHGYGIEYNAEIGEKEHKGEFCNDKFVEKKLESEEPNNEETNE